MVKTFVAVLSEEEALGKSMNALAHMALGMGHRVPVGKTPAVEVYFASAAVVRAFRTAGHEIYEASPDSAAFSDFTHTMTEGTGDEQLLRSRGTPESELNYFAAAICADTSDLAELRPVLSGARMLKAYQPSLGTAAGEFDFQAEDFVADDPSVPPKKVALVLQKNNPAGVLNAIVESCLAVGRRADRRQLRLLNFVDKDGQSHANISYHPFPILTPPSQSKHDKLAADVVAANPGLAEVVRSAAGNAVAVCLFGDKADVEAATKACSIWKAGLSPEDFAASREAGAAAGGAGDPLAVRAALAAVRDTAATDAPAP